MLNGISLRQHKSSIHFFLNSVCACSRTRASVFNLSAEQVVLLRKENGLVLPVIIGLHHVEGVAVTLLINKSYLCLRAGPRF